MSNHNANIRIMIVDDSPELIHMLLEDLQTDFAVTAALSADEALQMLAENELPDIVLLDVNMPGINGYEACEYIKNDPLLADIDVVFLSSNNSTEEIARGLAVGGADYLVKPYNSAALKTKLAHIQHLREQRLQWRDDAKNANDLVMTVLGETGSLGVVVNFMRTALVNENSPQLMENLLDSLRSYGLNAIAYWSAGDILECAATSEISSMLELELIERMRGSDQVLHKIGGKLIMVHRHSVLLIKNMPNDEKRCGSLQDNLQIILETVNSRLDYFMSQQQRFEQRQGVLDDIIASLSEPINNLLARQIKQREYIIGLVGDLSIDIEKAFFAMGLTETQESEILAILNRKLTGLADQLDVGMRLDEDFTFMLSHLSSAVKKALE